MAGLGAVRGLDTEGNSQREGTYRHSQHERCCQVGIRGSERFGRSLVGLGEDGQTALVFGLRCRSVNRCPCCAERKKARDRARAFQGAAEAGRIALVTLTIDPSDLRYLDPANRAGRDRPATRELLDDPRRRVIEESLRYQAWAWNRLRTLLSRRVFFRGSAYFRGVELQRSGLAHVHVVIRVPDLASYAALRAALRGQEDLRMTVPVDDRRAGLAIRAGFGPVVDVQLARSAGDVARYVTKDVAAYATKGTTAPMPRYTRRTAYSLGTGSRIAAWAPGWVRPTRIAGFRWQLAQASESVVRDALVRSDFVISDPSLWRIGSAAIAAGGTAG